MTTIRNNAGSLPSGALAAQQRHEVKEIASEYQRDLRAYKSSTENGLRQGGGLAEFAASVASKRERLAALRASPLSDVAPPSTLLRSAKSCTVLAAAMTGRATATAAAGASVVTHGAVVATFAVAYGAVASPIGAVTGTCGGLVAGAVSGALLPITPPLRPVTAVIGGIGGAVVSGVGGAVTPLLGIPGNIMSVPKIISGRGSLGGKTFLGIDRVAVAKAHVRHKKMSTHDIAVETDNILNNAANMAITKNRTPPKQIRGILLSGCGARFQYDMSSGESSFHNLM